MEIRGNIENGIVNLEIDGRLDLANAFTAEQHFLKYAENNSVFSIDMSKVDFITSAGVRALLTLYRTVSEKSGSVTLKGTQPQILEVLEETNFAELFTIEK